MTVRLVAADLDGTLVGRDRSVAPRVRAALAAAAARGVPCVPVTARRWSTAAAIIAELGLGPLALVAGGGAIRDVATGGLVDAAELEAATVAAAVGRIADAGLLPIVGVDGAERHLCGPARLDTAASRLYLFGIRGERDGAERLELEALCRPATRVLAMGDAGAIGRAAAACAGLAAHLLVQDCIVQLEAGPHQHELHLAADDKGGGLLRVCTRLGVDPADVLAIGDAPSDLPMLERAGTAVLMGQAGASLRRDGHIVAPGVDEDGAAWALERLVLDATL